MKKIELHRTLGISRPTLDAYLNLPDAPQPNGREYDAEAVREFIAQCAAKESTAANASPDLKSLKAREVLARCLKLEHDNAVAKGRYTDTELVKRECTRYALALKKACLAIPSKAPLLVGLDAVGIQEKLRDWISEPLNMLASGQWTGCECPNCNKEIEP